MILEAICYLLVVAGGTAVVLTREPKRQALMQSVFGMTLTILFLVLQAPDVALSEVAVGAAALPLMILVTLANVRVDPRPTSQSGEAATGSDSR